MSRQVPPKSTARSLGAPQPIAMETCLCHSIRHNHSPVYADLVRRYQLQDGCLMSTEDGPDPGQCCCYTLDATIWAETVGAERLRSCERMLSRPDLAFPDELARIDRWHAEIRDWLAIR